MKFEYRLFIIITAFLLLACGVYAYWTWYDTGVVEWIGTVALLLSGLLTLMCGGYFWFVSRRIDLRPEDRNDSEIADGAGEIGFFSPGSYFPFGIALATLITAIGVAYLAWWMVAVGIVAVLVTTAGMLFEYYTGARKAH